MINNVVNKVVKSDIDIWKLLIKETKKIMIRSARVVIVFNDNYSSNKNKIIRYKIIRYNHILLRGNLGKLSQGFPNL